MDPLVADFLETVRDMDPCHTITETSIVTGRVSLMVFPAVSAPVAERLVMVFPRDCGAGEMELCRALKIALVGQTELPRLLARIRTSLETRSRHEETLAGWRLCSYERGVFKTMKAERVRMDQSLEA